MAGRSPEPRNGGGRFTLIGNRLAVDFANTIYAPRMPGGALGSWEDLVDFLEVTGAVAGEEAVRLRGLGARHPGRTAGAFALALELRSTIRAMLAAIEAREPMRNAWVEAVNRVLARGAGHEALVPADRGWRLRFVRTGDAPLGALVPVARSAAALVAEGPDAPVRTCGNPPCVLHFYDDSRTGQRRWCSMAVCGNRMKVAAHARRARRSAIPPAARRRPERGGQISHCNSPARMVAPWPSYRFWRSPEGFPTGISGLTLVESPLASRMSQE